jgi:hypothetical protein
MSEELAGDEDGEPVASPSERLPAGRQGSEREARPNPSLSAKIIHPTLPLRTNTMTLYRVVLFLYDR